MPALLRPAESLDLCTAAGTVPIDHQYRVPLPCVVGDVNNAQQFNCFSNDIGRIGTVGRYLPVNIRAQDNGKNAFEMHVSMMIIR